MAAKFTTDMSRGGDLFSDYPENIRIAPELNGRHEHTDVEALAEDIERNGQHTPAIIRKDDEGYPVLVAGHRRWRAISLLNSRNETQRKILCTYRSGLDELGALRIAISENRFRRDVSPMDDAQNIHLLETKFGLTHGDVAAIYFPETPKDEASIRFVKQRVGLMELGPEAAQAVREGRVKLTAATALAKLTKVQQKARVEASKGGRVKGKALAESSAKVRVDMKELVEAAKAIIAEMEEQKVMVVEVHRDLVERLKGALGDA